MGRILLIIGVVLIILWLLGFFAFHLTTPTIHILIVIGVILVVLELFRGRRNYW